MTTEMVATVLRQTPRNATRRISSSSRSFAVDAIFISNTHALLLPSIGVQLLPGS